MNLNAADRGRAGQDNQKGDDDKDTGNQSPCPKCGGPTVLRTGRRGNFYGCKKYPSCDGVVKTGSRKQSKAKRK
jgi:ssDNA-binding Zn-finger/Zn-ribbon topoisomerase 1